MNKCTKICGIPKATLKRHSENKNSNVNLVKVCGRPPVFNSNMEKQFFGFKINDIRKLDYDIAEKYSLNHSFNWEKQIAGKKWFHSFMKRNPTLTLKQPEATSTARAKGFHRQNVMDFFDILEKIVDKHQIDSTSMFNVDESRFTTVQKKPQKVIS